MTRAFVFPGQGSQAVGMGQALAEAFTPARRVLEEVDDALGQKLSKLMFEGPEAELTLTANAQPALMAVSLAVVRVLDEEGGKPLPALASHVAGHSLGEYSALAAAGALGLADAARLLRLRGTAMQKAVPVGEGAMAALLGLDLPAAQEVAAEAAQGQVCDCANDNAPGQVVVSGAKAAVERAVEIAKTKGAKRAILLPVSAPFHCALMEPAAERLRPLLDDAPFKDLWVALVSNVDASPIGTATAVRNALLRQVASPVRWVESVQKMVSMGVKRFVEVGPGNVLTGLIKRIDSSVELINVSDVPSIEKFVESVR